MSNLKFLSDDDIFVPVKNQMSAQQLLTHTAGFSYGFNSNDMADQQYAGAKLWESKDLNDFVQRISHFPENMNQGLNGIIRSPQIFMV